MVAELDAEADYAGVQHSCRDARLPTSGNAATFVQMQRTEWAEGARKHGGVALAGVVLTAWAVPSVAEERYERQPYDSRSAVSTPRYVGGGLLGSLVGFGAGHAVQGRWSEDWPFAGLRFTEVVHVWILPQPSAYASSGFVDVRLSF